MPKNYPNPNTMQVSVPNPESVLEVPIYEGPANEAHRVLISGQYRATVADPWDANRDHEVMLHVFSGEDSRTGVGNSTVYNLPDHMREFPWNNDFASRVARVMTEIFGFEATTDTDGQTGIQFDVGTLRFCIGESMTGPSHTYAFTQDLTDVGEDGFARVVDDCDTISNEDISYRGSWSPWETARQFVRYAVPSFGKIAEKRAANADHTF